MNLPWFRALGISLILTELVESGVALWLKKHGTALIIVILVNVLTNPPVELISLAVFRINPDLFIIWIIIAETSVVAVEAMIYRKWRELFPHPWRFSILLNTVSFAAGLLLQFISGGILL